MKPLLFSCLLGSSFFMQLCAQKKFTLIYESNVCSTLDSLGNPIRATIVYTQYDKLIINDSVSYFWPEASFNEKITLKLPLGSTFYANAIYTNINSRQVVDQLAPYGNPQYRIREEWVEPGWELLNDTKQILGYICKKARLGSAKDSVIAWYANELPGLFGPSYFRGLPGTILQLICYWPHTISHLSVKEIRRENVPIVEPPDGELISKESFLKKFKRIWETPETW